MRHFSSSRPLYLHTHASTIHPGSFLSCTRSPSTSTSSHSPLRSWPPSPLPWGSTTPYSNSPGAQTPPPSTPLSLKSKFSFFFAVFCTSLVFSCSVHPFHLARPSCSLPRSLPLHPLLPSPLPLPPFPQVHGRGGGGEGPVQRRLPHDRERRLHHPRQRLHPLRLIPGYTLPSYLPPSPAFP